MTEKAKTVIVRDTKYIVPPKKDDGFVEEVNENRRKKFLDMTPEQRLKEGEALYKKGIEALLEMSDLIWAAKKRGDDTSPYLQKWGSMFNIMIRIGAGELSAELFKLYGREAKIMKVILRLPMQEQRKLLSGPVEVFDRDTHKPRAAFLPQMTDKERKLVFDGNHIRTIEEQEDFVRQEELKKNTPKEPIRPPRFKLDNSSRSVFIGKERVRFEDLAHMYSECRKRGWKLPDQDGDDEDEDE
jgi:hypothetical protein